MNLFPQRFKSFCIRKQILIMLFVFFGLAQGFHLPLIQKITADAIAPKSEFSIRQHSTQTKAPVLLGLYAAGYLGDQVVIDQELRSVDLWTGQQASLAGLFIDIADENPAYNVTSRLEKIWENGYTPFINLKTQETALSLAEGKADKDIRAIAQAYSQWAEQGNRVAYIAPLPEMNIAGETYSLDPNHFKQAYQRIYQIFKDANISPQAIRWVFSPNGWSKIGHYFETYYPGDAVVDIVAFSAYNWGYCPRSDWKHWSTPKEVFEPYLQRIQRMASEKPIFIAQTATSSFTEKGSNRDQKNQWIQDSYRYLAAAPEVQGILYFNIHKECDWELFGSEGYRSAVQSNVLFQYQSPSVLFHNGE